MPSETEVIANRVCNNYPGLSFAVIELGNLATDYDLLAARAEKAGQHEEAFSYKCRAAEIRGWQDLALIEEEAKLHPATEPRPWFSDPPIRERLDAGETIRLCAYPHANALGESENRSILPPFWKELWRDRYARQGLLYGLALVALVIAAAIVTWGGMR